MNIKKYVGKTKEEAIEKAKNDLGSNAVIMHTKSTQPKGLAKLFVKSKVVVTAALDDQTVYNDEERRAEEARNIEKAKQEEKELLELTKAPVDVPPMKKPEKETKNVKDFKSEEASIEKKLDKLQSLIEESNEKSSNKESKEVDKKKEPEKNAKDEASEKANNYKKLIREQLILNEVEEDIVDSIMDKVGKSLPDNASIDQILGSIYQKIILMLGQPYLIDTTKTKKTKFVFFLGSTGVGKTTTIAKVASKLKLEKKVNLALVTADTYRIAAVEQLKTYANILSVPLKVIYTPKELGGMIEELEDYDMCLIDTAGRSHKNDEQLEDIKELLDQIPISDRQVYLVLNAGTKYSDLKQIAEVYSKITDYSIIFTKLDETSSSGAMLNLKMMTKCPLSYVTWGQNVPDDIGVVNAQKIAKKLLGGDNVDK